MCGHIFLSCSLHLASSCQCSSDLCNSSTISKAVLQIPLSWPGPLSCEAWTFNVMLEGIHGLYLQSLLFFLLDFELSAKWYITPKRRQNPDVQMKLLILFSLLKKDVY